ncbi:MESH1 pyrophosphohydrolase, partial [Polypterus senegalus]
MNLPNFSLPPTREVGELVAALLHDTVEDTETSFDELDGKFGATVARIVQEVTDDKMLPKQERKQQQILKAPLCSHQAKLVKLADKLYNLRDLNRSTPVESWRPPPSSCLPLLAIPQLSQCWVSQSDGRTPVPDDSCNPTLEMTLP